MQITKIAMEALFNSCPIFQPVVQTDYDLGQIVTVKSDKWGVSMTMRITEIIENYDSDGLTREVTFGRGMLTLSQKLREV